MREILAVQIRELDEKIEEIKNRIKWCDEDLESLREKVQRFTQSKRDVGHAIEHHGKLMKDLEAERNGYKGAVKNAKEEKKALFRQDRQENDGQRVDSRPSRSTSKACSQ